MLEVILNPLASTWDWFTSRWDSAWEAIKPFIGLGKAVIAGVVSIGLALPALLDTSISALNVAIGAIPATSVGGWYPMANAIVPLYEIGQLLMAIIALRIAAVAVKIIKWAMSLIF